MLKTLGAVAVLLASQSASVSQTVSPAEYPKLSRSGCYGYPADRPSRNFCLRDDNLMISEVFGYKEGFGDCGTFKILPGGRLSLEWLSAGDGALVQPIDPTKPLSITCTVTSEGGDDISLHDCVLTGHWKFLPANMYKPTIKIEDCAPRTDDN